MAAERILVVDDEPQIVRLCVQILGEMGYTVHGIEDGLVALDRLKDEPVDLLLVDIKMPEIDGLVLLRQARELDPNLAAVVITGYATMDRAIEALRAGARGFVLKPFGMKDLALAVEEALERRRLEQERLRLQAQLPVLEVSQALMSEGDPVSLAAQILDVVVRQTGAERALVVLPRGHGGEMEVIACVGCDNPGDAARTVKIDDLFDRALRDKAPLVIEAEGLGDVGWPWRLLEADGETAHLVLVPLHTRKTDVGVLGLCWQSVGPVHGLSTSDLNLLSILGRQVAVALENARLYATEQQRTAELGRALEQQQELDRLKDEFIRNVSHELRTPLALVLGYAELLADGVVGEPASGQVEPLQIIVERCRKLSALVENITTILENPGPGAPAEAVSLQELVRAALSDFRVMAERSEISLRSEVSGHVPPVLGNRHQLRTVIENLLDNALKFTPAGGAIVVSLYGRPTEVPDTSTTAQAGPLVAKEEIAPVGEVVFRVADTGIGIAPQHQAQIFDRFFQVDGTLRRTYGGSGLGLALVKEIVEAHRGSVQVESVLDRGSVFTVRLPAAGQPD